MYQDGLSGLLSFAQSFVVQNLFPTDPGNCRCGGLGNSCPCLLGLVRTLWSLCPGAVCSDLTMFGHGGLSQMGTKGRFPRDGLAAQASCCGSGSLFWGGGWGPGPKSLPAEDSRPPDTVSTATRALGEWFLREGRSWGREAGSGNSLPGEVHHGSGLQRG